VDQVSCFNGILQLRLVPHQVRHFFMPVFDRFKELLTGEMAGDGGNRADCQDKNQNKFAG
jgi:hypothetical protein